MVTPPYCGQCIWEGKTLIQRCVHCQAEVDSYNPKPTSPRPLPFNTFLALCLALNYKPEDVMSIQVRKDKATVVYRDTLLQGMPRSVSHPVVSLPEFDA